MAKQPSPARDEDAARVARDDPQRHVLALQQLECVHAQERIRLRQ